MLKDALAETLKAAPAPLRDGAPGFAVDGYVEAHIEQGPRLENESKTIGVVTAIQGSRRYIVTIDGEEAHAGTTPRAARKDAYAAATRIAAAMYEATTDADDTLRFTIGRVEVSPGSPNTVPGKATLHHRHAPSRRRRAGGARGDAARPSSTARPRPARPRIERVTNVAPTDFDPKVIDLVRAKAEALKLSQHGHALGRRPRRHAHRQALPRRHDLRALRARHQPQRDRERDARRPRRRHARAGRGAGGAGEPL